MAIVITKHTAIKLIELIVVCILIGLFLHDGSGVGSKNYFLAPGSYLGYLIILVGVFAGGLMGTPVNRRVDLFYCLIGCVLFVAVGSICLSNGNDKVIGWLSIVQGVVFVIDAVLVFRNEP